MLDYIIQCKREKQENKQDIFHVYKNCVEELSCMLQEKFPGFSLLSDCQNLFYISWKSHQILFLNWDIENNYLQIEVIIQTNIFIPIYLPDSNFLNSIEGSRTRSRFNKENFHT